MLVKKVEEELLQRLKTGRYAAGEKLPSIREMSVEFKCSYVIAFRAVKSLKKAGCLETFKGNGTFVTRDVQKRLNKKLLAYIFDKPGNLRFDQQDSLCYTCFQRTVRKAGYIDLALQEDELLSAHDLDNLAGALITLRTPLMEQLTARKIPCVFITSLGNSYGFPSVTPDFYQGSLDVMHHLIHCGYRRIGAVTIDSAEFNQASFAPRIQAYYDAIKEAGLQAFPPLEWNIRKPEMRRRLRDVMEPQQHPDSFFIPNDKLAVEVIQELSELGFRVPEDIGVAGLENLEFLYPSTLPLTTASFDSKVLVEKACALLLKMIDRPSEKSPASVKVPMTFIQRKSSGGTSVHSTKIQKKGA